MKTILTLTLSLSLFSPLGALVSRAADAPPKPATPPAPAAPAAPAAPGTPAFPAPAPVSPELAARRAEARAEMMKKYDKNGNGKIDPDEIEAMRKEREAEMLKKYDKDGNGKLDDEENKGRIEDLKKQREEMLNRRKADLPKPAPKDPAPKEEKKEEKK